MRKVFVALVLIVLMSNVSIEAKKYKFNINNSYEVEIVRVGKKGEKYLCVSGKAASVDNAMDNAMQNAVVACLFTGVEGTAYAGRIPAICDSVGAYHNNKKYFDDFFKKGEFMQYVRNVNSGYPSGANNVRKGFKSIVKLWVVVRYDALREKMEKDGVVKSLDVYF